jgi:HSP20 family protein
MDDFFGEQLNTEAELTAIKSGNKAKPKGEEGQLTVDVHQTEDEIVVKSTIAGVTADDIDISITNDMVTIKGSRDPDEKVKQSDYYYQELYWGPFSRSIILPEEIDSDNAKASMKNGILTIRLPKLAKSRVKKVKISS